ncbi:response regulator transcription factor [Inhella proteolytica]|uniref:Response regulator transcription factor n=1 Tax=Inhella proteolytica TaxID=2795029 RepID=A0A931NIU3_9BURK|nr:response regulator transcription factor [Inhella proteolytica]MBH9579706.1 response regulator transcription factor [Inhella proteolytica]
MSAHILLVEDDRSLAEWIADYLSAQGFVVSCANRGDTALQLIEQDLPDLVVLDLHLPGLDGFRVCQAMRRFSRRPVLMLTASDSEADEVRSLELGADDFLSKPVRPQVLLARVRALLRRDAQAAALPVQLRTVGALRLDLASRSASWQGKAVGLSSQEFDVLALLVEHAGTAVTRRRLIEVLRGIDYDGFDRSVDMTLSRLRRKFGDDPEAPQRFKTVWGVGYLLAPEGWAA